MLLVGMYDVIRKFVLYFVLVAYILVDRYHRKDYLLIEQLVKPQVYYTNNSLH